MNPKIVIIDYGMGNLRNVQKGFEWIGFEARVTRNKKEIERASAIVLPGVGAFKDCMENLEKFGLIEPLLRSIQKGKPYLGICLGLQILFSESEEFGFQKGLDLIRGKVVKFKPDQEHKVPHMGWNGIEKKMEVPFFRGLRVETFSILFIPTMLFRKNLSGCQPSQTMGFLSSRASGKKIFLAPNFIRKRVSRKG